MGYTSIPLASCPELAKMGRVGIQWGHGKIRFHTWSINSCSTVWFSTLASGTGSSLVFLRLFTAGSCLPSISCALLQPHHPSLQTFLSSSIRWFEGASILSSMRIEAPSNHHILPTVTQEVPCPHCCEQIWETKMVTRSVRLGVTHYKLKQQVQKQCKVFMPILHTFISSASVSLPSASAFSASAANSFSSLSSNESSRVWHTSAQTSKSDLDTYLSISYKTKGR